MRLRHAFVIAALCPALLAAQTNKTAAAAFIPDRLARIDSWVDDLIKQQKIPGAVVMLVVDGKVAYHKAYGVRDIGTQVAQQPNDIFRIASQTKAITSLAVMMLWEEGRFGLDDPIGNYIPAFKEKQFKLHPFASCPPSLAGSPARSRSASR